MDFCNQSNGGNWQLQIAPSEKFFNFEYFDDFLNLDTKIAGPKKELNFRILCLRGQDKL